MSPARLGRKGVAGIRRRVLRESYGIFVARLSARDHPGQRQRPFPDHRFAHPGYDFASRILRSRRAFAPPGGSSRFRGDHTCDEMNESPGRRTMPGIRRGRPTRREILKVAGLAAGAGVTSSLDIALGVSRASAAGYPERPIKIIVPFAPAGPTDIMARILAQNLGLSARRQLHRRKPAGRRRQYRDRLCGACRGRRLHAAGHLQRLCRQSRALRENPLRSLQGFRADHRTRHLAECRSWSIPKLGINSIAELIARAKANPDELNYASPGAGTTPHLSGEFLKIVGGIEMTHVPFSGAAPAIQALLGGTTQVAVVGAAAGASLYPIRRAQGAGHHRRASLVRSAGRADHGRTRLQGFHRRHVPGLSWRRPKPRPRSSSGWRRNRSKC